MSGLVTANCRCSLRRPNSMILQTRFQSLASKTASSLISLDLLEVYIQNEKNMPQTKLLIRFQCRIFTIIEDYIPQIRDLN